MCNASLIPICNCKMIKFLNYFSDKNVISNSYNYSKLPASVANGIFLYCLNTEENLTDKMEVGGPK